MDRRSSPPLGVPQAGLSRRAVLRGAAAAVVAAPRIHVRRRPKLRVMGTHVTLQEPIRRRAEKDLGIDLEFSPGGSAEVLQRASTDPTSFDVYEQWSNSIEILWQARAIQAIDRSRLDRWDEVNALCKSGRLTDSARYGAGAAPFRMLNVQADDSLGSHHTGRLSFLPYVHNVDSFGYDRSIVPEGTPYETESWGWLLEPRWRGKVGIVNEPTIGLFDLALAARAQGLIEFDDIGAITRDELDELFEIVVGLQRRGHFSAFWTSVPHSVDLMSKGRVVIESMFSPGASALRGMGHDVLYAAPKEGYRAWHGVMCLSSAASEEATDAAYAYMNWWLDGWAGAFVARQGYYISTPERSRAHLSGSEWNYWYAGQPAEGAILGTDGKQVAEAGQLRRGGSYTERLSNVAVWNTVMDTYEYSLGGWFSLLSA